MTTHEHPWQNTSVCPRCGAGLRCGMLAGDAQCWCVQLPNIMPVPAARTPVLPAADNAATVANSDAANAAACFCPACLQQITNERLNAS